MTYQGLFVGLTTLDFIYLSDRPLQSNQKIVAQDYLTVAGGPATNAAVAFADFGHQSQLLSVIGQHPLTELVKRDLAQCSVISLDLIPEQTTSPPVSSIIVNASTGERAIISLNAVRSQASCPIQSQLLANIDLVLVDGHQLETSLQIAAIARQQQIPVVLDGGSWKPGLTRLLPYVDYAICSANFAPPQCPPSNNLFEFLADYGIKHLAITQGEKPIIYSDLGVRATVDVPAIKALDTLGAGDIFHGAFCHYILQEDFPKALQLAARVASRSCLSFGTRSWLNNS